MLFVHKIELRMTAAQGEYLRRCCGIGRFVFNQLVEKWKSGEKYNRKAFQKYCSTMRKGTPWMQQVSARAVYEAADDFNDAVNNFFRTCKIATGKKWNPPTFKKRGQRDSCRFSFSTQFRVDGRKLRIQGLKEWIEMRESIRFEGKVRSVTIKPCCGKWYASFLVDVSGEPKPITTREPSVGVDFGLKSLAVLCYEALLTSRSGAVIVSAPCHTKTKQYAPRTTATITQRIKKSNALRHESITSKTKTSVMSKAVFGPRITLTGSEPTIGDGSKKIRKNSQKSDIHEKLSGDFCLPCAAEESVQKSRVTSPAQQALSRLRTPLLDSAIIQRAGSGKAISSGDYTLTTTTTRASFEAGSAGSVTPRSATQTTQSKYCEGSSRILATGRSNGEIIENPKPLQKSLRKLKKHQRQMNRRFVKNAKQQSKRYKKSAAKVARIHKKVTDQRSAAQHKFTSSLVKRFDRIVIEDLNVSGMQKNRRLSRAISDASWSSLRWQLEYKSKWAGVELVIADRFFASSKTCSGCGHKIEKLSLSQRTFKCPCCSLSLDRDLNAAINLDRYKTTTRPIRASRKTDDLGQCKSTDINVAGSIEVVSINPSKMEDRYQPA